VAGTSAEHKEEREPRASDLQTSSSSLRRGTDPASTYSGSLVVFEAGPEFRTPRGIGDLERCAETRRIGGKSTPYESAYQIDGVTVSNFCTPDFFDPWSVGQRYDHKGAISEPLSVLPGGYLSGTTRRAGTPGCSTLAQSRSNLISVNTLSWKQARDLKRPARIGSSAALPSNELSDFAGTSFRLERDGRWLRRRLDRSDL
jgi:hypothetical protein